MNPYLLSFGILFCCGWGCTDESTNTHTTAETTQADNLEPNCSFQIQGIQNLPGTLNKAVTVLRNCNALAQPSKELILFAQGEPMDKEKKCNIFATTDTSLNWRLELSTNHIDVYFIEQDPVKATILLQAYTVADSIEITYHVTLPTIN